MKNLEFIFSDFVVFTYNSGSTSGSIWQKLSYTDTISSVIMGNGSGGSTKFGVSAADVHEFSGSVYVSGNIYAEELSTILESIDRDEIPEYYVELIDQNLNKNLINFNYIESFKFKYKLISLKINFILKINLKLMEYINI